MAMIGNMEMTGAASSRYDRLVAALTAVFAPEKLEILDESAKHASHVARTGISGGQTHYHVLMVSPVFAGMSRVARSRAVHEALAGEFSTGLHALSLTLRTSAEAG
jgi:stress-induced morphogen